MVLKGCRAMANSFGQEASYAGKIRRLTRVGYAATQALRLAHARALPSGSPVKCAWGTSTRSPLLLKDQAWYAHMMLLFSNLPSAHFHL